MHYYKKEIDILRRQLAGSYNNEAITKMENEIKSKALQLQQLYEENSALKVWKQEDEQEYAALNREGDYEQKLAELKDEIRDTRREWRESNHRKIEEQKRLINQHEKLVLRDHKCRKIQEVIQTKKRQPVVKEQPIST